MGLHTQLPIYKVSYDLIGVVVEAARHMPRDVKRLLGEKLRDECIELANVLRRRGLAVDFGLTKAHQGRDRSEFPV